jgi:hypothetical protein
MTDMTAPAKSGGAPWHLWVVGVLALLWNGYGAFDYLMTNTQGEAYLAGLGATPAQIEYYLAMPAWMNAAWAFGVWGGVLGALLLLLRSRWALWAFAASLLGLIGSWVHTFTSNGLEIAGAAGMIMSAVITIVALFLLSYARMMQKAGVLR